MGSGPAVVSEVGRGEVPLLGSDEAPGAGGGEWGDQGPATEIVKDSRKEQDSRPLLEYFFFLV